MTVPRGITADEVVARQVLWRRALAEAGVSAEPTLVQWHALLLGTTADVAQQWAGLCPKTPSPPATKAGGRRRRRWSNLRIGVKSGWNRPAVLEEILEHYRRRFGPAYRAPTKLEATALVAFERARHTNAQQLVRRKWQNKCAARKHRQAALARLRSLKAEVDKARNVTAAVAATTVVVATLADGDGTGT